MAINFYDEEFVLQEMGNLLKSHYRYFHSGAYNDAPIRIRALLKSCNDNRTFSTA
jgi:hypothetical protein